MNQSKLSNQSNYHIGFCFLKILMCYEVIMNHFGGVYDGNKLTYFFYEMRPLAVPVFMMLSFLFSGKYFLEHDESHFLNRRMKRLIVPQVGWSIIYFVVYSILGILFSMQLVSGIQDLIWQIFTGHSPNLNASMWYQVDLIILTLVYYVLFKVLDKKKAIITSWILFVLSFISQYSGLNVLLFDGLRHELKYPLGRLVEVIPYATIGISTRCLLSIMKNKFQDRKRLKWLLYIVSIIFLLAMSLIFPSTASGFGYSGLDICFKSLLLVMIFGAINPQRLPEIISCIIVKISKYTFGIYCIHRMIINIIKGIFALLDMDYSGGVLYCLLVFGISLLIVYLISLIPSKLCHSLVE